MICNSISKISTSHSSVNNITFQKNRSMSESFGATPLALWPQTTHMKQAFIHLKSEVNLTRESRSTPAQRRKKKNHPIYFPLSQVCTVCPLKNVNWLKRSCCRVHTEHFHSDPIAQSGARTIREFTTDTLKLFYTVNGLLSSFYTGKTVNFCRVKWIKPIQETYPAFHQPPGCQKAFLHSGDSRVSHQKHQETLLLPPNQCQFQLNLE